MKSTSHAGISLVVAAGALAVTTPTIPAWAVVVVAVGVGVGIDVDHFLLARRYAGDWSALRRCLRDPTIVLFDQDAIFEEGDVGALNRLLSHVVIGGVAVPVLWLWRPYVAGLVAASLYAHVLADLVATTRNRVAVDPDDVPADVPVAGREGDTAETARE